jgi:hypothetical protein
LCPTVVLIWKPIFSIFFLRNNALSENVVWVVDEQQRLPTRQDIKVTYWFTSAVKVSSRVSASDLYSWAVQFNTTNHRD